MARTLPPNPRLDDFVRVLRSLQQDVDKIRNGQFTVRGDIDMRGHRIRGLAKPIDSSDAQTKLADGTAQFAPLASKYVVAGSVDPNLPNERLLSGSASITVTDNGGGSTVVVSATQSWFDALYQPLDAELTALAGLTSAANKVPMFSGSGTATLLDFKDEDDMVSDSATAVASQQSIKAYVDTAVGAFTTDHAALSNLAWTTSGHTGTASRIAGFSGAGAAAEYAIGTDIQAYDADLASWAAVTRASGFDTFAATPSSANLRSLVTDESGTGALLFAGGDIGAATGTSLDLSGGGGSISLAQGQRLYLGAGGALSGPSIRHTGAGVIQFTSAGVDIVRITSTALDPAIAGLASLGTAGSLGWSALYLDEAGAGTQTAALVAPTLAGNVTWTGPVETSTIPGIVASVDLSAQSAAIGTTTLYTPTSDGLYRVSANLVVTQAATSSSTLGATTIGWTEADSSVAQTATVPGSGTAGIYATTNVSNTTTSRLQGSVVIHAKSGVAITYAIAYASSGATPMQYCAHLRVERL